MKKITLFILTFFAAINLHAQNIRVYFTKSVDNNTSLITDAQYSSHLEDTIVKLIDDTQTTLDIAVWDNGSSAIVAALNNAYGRGVVVRYITSDNALNTALAGLNSNIPVLERDATLTSNVMHNKFIISDNTTILSGSMNFGMGSMEDDYNNIVIIENSTLASTYLIEFNEMWGGSAALPNLANSKFGPDKTDNTTHNFMVGTSPVQLYFSPTDNTTQKIVDAVNTADFTLDVAMFTLTNNDLGDAIVAAKNRGVNVRVIMENESYIGSEFNNLVSAGIPVISHEAVSFDFHHKYCVIDAASFASDPTVVTGSHNWTNSAEEEYDENTLIIHDATVAGQYQEEFQKRWDELNTGIHLNGLPDYFVSYPFGSNKIYVRNASPFTWNIHDLSGNLILTGSGDPMQTIDISTIKTGYYILLIKSKSEEKRADFIFIKPQN